MSDNIVPQTGTDVKRELLALADRCLQEFNDCWAAWLVSGDHTMFLAAMAAEQDREALLAEVGYVT